MVGMLSTVSSTRAFLLDSRNSAGVCRMNFLRAILRDTTPRNLIGGGDRYTGVNVINW